MTTGISSAWASPSPGRRARVGRRLEQQAAVEQAEPLQASSLGGGGAHEQHLRLWHQREQVGDHVHEQVAPLEVGVAPDPSHHRAVGIEPQPPARLLLGRREAAQLLVLDREAQHLVAPVKAAVAARAGAGPVADQAHLRHEQVAGELRLVGGAVDLTEDVRLHQVPHPGRPARTRHERLGRAGPEDVGDVDSAQQLDQPLLLAVCDVHGNARTLELEAARQVALDRYRADVEALAIELGGEGHQALLGAADAERIGQQGDPRTRAVEVGHGPRHPSDRPPRDRARAARGTAPAGSPSAPPAPPRRRSPRPRRRPARASAAGRRRCPPPRPRRPWG